MVVTNVESAKKIRLKSFLAVCSKLQRDNNETDLLISEELIKAEEFIQDAYNDQIKIVKE